MWGKRDAGPGARSRATPYGVGGHRRGGETAFLCRRRGGACPNRSAIGQAAGRAVPAGNRCARTLSTRRGGGRGDVCQQERRLDPEARRRARCRAAGPGRARPAGCRILCEPRQEVGGRRRARRQSAGPDDGAPPFAGLRDRDARRGRCAGRRHLPRASRRHDADLERSAMIAKLAGLLDQVTSDGAVIDVGSVGYLVFCSARSIAQLPPPGGAARLLVETHVREDHIHLYGFIDAVERDWFRLLTTVQGVGARLALALLSAVSPDQLALAILSQDKATLARADGVGPRLAARIANELRDKIGGLATPPPIPVPPSPAPPHGADA